MDDIDIVELTLDGAQQAFAGGRTTSEALTQAFLDRIALYNPHYNAIIFLNPDALEDARAIDRRRSAGEALGPLAGVPVVVKDPMDMVGFPTTAGWSLLHGRTGGVDLMPGTDAPVVARLRAAGAVILGKTNVPVLSHTGSHANDSWAGPTYNAAGRQFLPGGSSAGTACAVASSMAVLGLAEETGGSIQNPASAQALVGIKPSFALVPNAGVMPLSGLRDVVGPIARCVRDAALTLDVLAGYCGEDPKTVAAIGKIPRGGYAANLSREALRGRRIGLYGPGWRDLPLSVETEALYSCAQDELRARGAELVADPFLGSGFAALRQPTVPDAEFDARGLESMPYDMQKYLERMGPDTALQSFEAFAAATAAQDPFGPSGVLGFMPRLPDFVACLAAPRRAPDMAAFIALREAYLALFDAVFARERLDVLVFPQMREELAPLHGGGRIHETVVSEINIAGLPAVTVPAGYHGSGAPFGLVFVGRMWSEADLLACAYDYEASTAHRRAPELEMP
ncbi:amidase [Lichenicoccus roseus]|uniref:Amidase n=1 Tax=Lichenicoccus roseus TaxID=2683649 RepID=A0A5R9J6Y4_9PROT|nr:amidase [Lichenicoccus roseus]TLU72613.1 amidase [Lichenicoccus roseus]